MEFLKKAKNSLVDTFKEASDQVDEMLEDKNQSELEKNLNKAQKTVTRFYGDNKTYINMGLIALGTAVLMKCILQPTVVVVHK